MQLTTGPLVSAACLAGQLAAPGLVVLDATANLDPLTAAGEPYDVRSGRSGWALAHVPGSRFADLVGELSDPGAPPPVHAARSRALRDGAGIAGRC